jgi:hypothetical protein
LNREGRELGAKQWWVSNKKPRLRAIEEGRIGVEESKREGLGILESGTGVTVLELRGNAGERGSPSSNVGGTAFPRSKKVNVPLPECKGLTKLLLLLYTYYYCI